MELRNLLGMKNFELFDFDYPIADSVWKKEFENLFVDYYYFYEIGSETIDRWKYTLRTRLNLIMPYYNELYQSKLFDINPLLTTKLKEEVDDTSSTSNEQESTLSDSGEIRSDDTEYPQTSNIDTDIPTSRGRTQSENEGVTSSSGQSSVVRDYSKVIEGFSGNQNELLKSYRDNIININRMLISDLKQLFILVY